MLLAEVFVREFTLKVSEKAIIDIRVKWTGWLTPLLLCFCDALQTVQFIIKSFPPSVFSLPERKHLHSNIRVIQGG
jgi:hypothetical protein